MADLKKGDKVRIADKYDGTVFEVAPQQVDANNRPSPVVACEFVDENELDRCLWFPLKQVKLAGKSPQPASPAPA